jgi:hypothetical protein
VFFERRIARLAAVASPVISGAKAAFTNCWIGRTARKLLVRWMRATPREASAWQTFSYNTTSARRNL